MAIITKPTISKGQANEFDLNKSDLAAVSKVVNDSYFSDQANWSKVIMEYKSAEGNQHEMIIFDASEASPKGNFEISEKARDDWEVQSVKIMDFDGGYLKLERGDLTVADFDILLSSRAINSTSAFSIVDSSATYSFSDFAYSFSYTSADSSTFRYANVQKQIDLSSSERIVAEFVLNNIGDGAAGGNNLVIGFLNNGDATPVETGTTFSAFRGFIRVNIYNGNSLGQGNVYSQLDTTSGSESLVGDIKSSDFLSGDIINVSVNLVSNELIFRVFASDGTTQTGSDLVLDISAYVAAYDILNLSTLAFNATNFQVTLNQDIPSANIPENFRVLGDLTVEDFDIALGSVGGSEGTANSNFVTWDEEIGGGTFSFNATGGVSGSSDTVGPFDNVYSNQDAFVGDFDLSFQYDASKFFENFIGVSTEKAGVNFAYNGHYGIGRFPNPTTTFINNAKDTDVSSFEIAGVNTFRLNRTGSTLTGYLNENLVFTATVSGTLFPFVRPYDQDAVAVTTIN